MFTERIDELRSDDRGVSPVLGVALLIAITVTLVAVIGVVVMGVGTSSGAPQAKLVFQNDSGDAVMIHQGGDDLNGDQFTLEVEDNSASGSLSASSIPGEFTAGDSTTVATGIREGDVIRIVWNPEGSDKSQVIATYEVG